jgi:hypothetical protein
MVSLASARLAVLTFDPPPLSWPAKAGSDNRETRFEHGFSSACRGTGYWMLAFARA